MTVSGRVEDLRDAGVQVLDDGDPLPADRENGDGLVAGVDVCRRKESGEWAGYLWSPGWVEMWRIDVATVATVAQSGAIALTGVQDVDVDAVAADVVAQVAQSGAIALSGTQDADVLSEPGVTAAIAQSGAITLTGVQAGQLLSDPGVKATVSQSGAITLTGVQEADVTSDSGFTPADLPTLEAWFDATDGDTLTIGSGNDVDQWDDKSGNNHSLTPGVGTPQLDDTINGLDAISFASGAQHFFEGQFPINDPTTGAWTILVVMHFDSVVGTRNVIDSDGTDRIAQFIRHTSGTTQTIGFNTGGSATTDSGATLSTDTDYLLTTTNDGGDPYTVEMLVDGASAGSTTASSGTQNYDVDALFDVGRRRASGSSSNISGSIGEIIACSSKLTAQEMSDVETYLADKWGLTL